jgi:hypothetical protein
VGPTTSFLSLLSPIFFLLTKSNRPKAQKSPPAYLLYCSLTSITVVGDGALLAQLGDAVHHLPLSPCSPEAPTPPPVEPFPATLLLGFPATLAAGISSDAADGLRGEG